MVGYSVIIATHGRPELLARAIRSIRASENGEVTVIVVSDDQSMETCEMARTCLTGGDDLFISRGGAPGPARSRNLGLEVARSDQVLFLDDDDEWSPGFLDALIATRPAPPRTVRFCDYSIAMDANQRTHSTPPVPVAIGHRDPNEVHVRNFIPNSCLVYPLDLARTLRFDESLVVNEDWDFLLAALQTHRLAHVALPGPIIHKTDRGRGDRRGAVNDHLLPQACCCIYRKGGQRPRRHLRHQAIALFEGDSVAADGMLLNGSTPSHAASRQPSRQRPRHRIRRPLAREAVQRSRRLRRAGLRQRPRLQITPPPRVDPRQAGHGSKVRTSLW